MENIRNFVIIAHIDHGKSTLADRFLELTGTVEKRKMREQFLDMHPLEREKGITIKMQPVRMLYKLKVKNEKLKVGNSETSNFELFTLNLIDTPGHVDFTYEVSRALAAVEGAILLVDATQGVQAQTLANLHLAKRENLIIIPAINKIDLPFAEVEKTEEEIKTLLRVSSDEILKISAKTGQGVAELLQTVVDGVSPPRRIGEENNFSALVFDSMYDSYQGVIAYVRLFNGSIGRGERIKFLRTGAESEAIEVGVFLPNRTPVEKLVEGEIGYIATGFKEPEKVRVGDTITRYIDVSKFRHVKPLPGYKEPEPMIFASIFPQTVNSNVLRGAIASRKNQDEYELLRESLKKLKLNDAAISFEPEEASVLGRGFRVGFLGMLHAEIVAERLRREYNLSLVFTNPSVSFRVQMAGGKTVMVYSASKMPRPYEVLALEELWAEAEVILPPQFLGALTSLVHERAGEIFETMTLTGGRLLIKFRAPLREIIVDFYDKLKSISQGFASMAYEAGEWRRADLIRLNILVAGEEVPALAEIIPRSKAYARGRERTQKLKEILSRELFSIAIQAEADGRIVARETVSALRKDVTGYLYGGDRTRKMKLWKKQQKGKKKLEKMGRVEIPPEVFIKMLKNEPR